MTRPHWYASFIEGRWGVFEGQAFEEFSPEIHVVEPFELPDAWERFESMDHGANHPTAWHLWAVDHDGNLVIADEYYGPGLVSKHAPTILERRKRRHRPWQLKGQSNVCWADPSIRASHGLTNRWGEPASVWTEYRDQGIVLRAANNDRQAGYLRLLELLHVEVGRISPAWSRVPANLGGAPHLYVFSTCRHLIEQFHSAPIASDSADLAEAVDRRWESEHGHAVASARYGAMSRPTPSPKPTEEEESPQAELLRKFEARQELRWSQDDLVDIQ